MGPLQTLYTPLSEPTYLIKPKEGQMAKQALSMRFNQEIIPIKPLEFIENDINYIPALIAQILECIELLNKKDENETAINEELEKYSIKFKEALRIQDRLYGD